MFATGTIGSMRSRNMDVRRSGRWLRRLLLVSCLGAGISGCQSTSPVGTVMERIGNPFSVQTSPETVKKNAKTMPVVRKQRTYHHGGMAADFVPVPGAPAELNPISLPPYVIGPPDILQIETLKGLVIQPVKGPHLVRPDGTVGIGIYGAAKVAGLT